MDVMNVVNDGLVDHEAVIAAGIEVSGELDTAKVDVEDEEASEARAGDGVLVGTNSDACCDVGEDK